MEFELKTHFIELDNLLKAAAIVSNGVEAKIKIRSGVVMVNGILELRVRRKLCRGDVVNIAEQEIKII